MPGARAVAAEVRTGRRRAVDVVDEALERAAEVQERTNAFVSIDVEGSRAAARAVDEAVARGEDPGPLAGVPIAVKDNLCTRGRRTTAGSALLRDFVPPYDATAVARLERAGAITIGKTNLDEFGMGSSSEFSAFGPVRHPADATRVPGGSSGGSAVAVAAGVVPLALGSDTGGSVRQPAAFCGVVGLKPTYGRVSRSGLIAYASSLDAVGVLAAEVADAALALEVVEGPDGRDATCLAPPPAGLRATPTDRPLRVRVVRELSGDGVAPGVRAALDGVARRLEAAGVEVGEASVPSVRFAVPTYYLVATAEASSNLARYDATIYGARHGTAVGQEEATRDARAHGLGREVQRRVLMGTFALSAGWYDAYYGRALQVRRRIADEVAAALEGADALLTPTTPTVAWPLGARAHDPISMYVGDVTTCLANLAGLPALSVPAGVAEDGLPCGAQLVGRPFDDETVLALGAVAARPPG